MTTSRHWTTLIPWITAFAISMAFLESAVVIYLRDLYYPGGFAFPLTPIRPHIAITELLREVATMVMLLAPGALISTARIDRFAWFCFCFGVWDIFYYVFLKAILDWPATIFEPDILFLVPVVWVGPVLAPCLVSIGLILLAFVLLHRRSGDPQFQPKAIHWSALATSGSIILYTFMEEPCGYILRTAGVMAIPVWPMPDTDALVALRGYIPAHYSWWAFCIALVVGAWVLVDLYRHGLRGEVAR